MDPFVFFGGKGGVGKTTVSAAYGRRCAADGLRTLVVSTDPAHSLTDVFDQSFGDSPTPVDTVEGLDALQLDPDEEVTQHLQQLRRDLSEQVSATMVNEINRQLEMAHGTPGAYESALFDRFVDVMRNCEAYDRVIFDTAPSGSTLRLLALPELLEGWIDRLMYKRRKSIDLFEKAAIGNNEPRRVMDGDPVLARLESRKEFFEFAGKTLRDDAGFFLVVNPDELSLAETERSIAQLQDNGLAVRGLVANKLTPSPDADENGRGATYLRDRVETERAHLERLHEEFTPPVVAEIGWRVSEIKGGFLVEVASELDIETTIEPPTHV